MLPGDGAVCASVNTGVWGIQRGMLDPSGAGSFEHPNTGTENGT